MYFMPDRENVSAKYGRVLSGESPIIMQNNLYVSSLAWATTDDTLRAYFATIGEVKSASVIKDKMSGRSRGFGFVEMATEEAAAEAVAKLNETDLDGRIIRVAIAQPREERPRREFNNAA
jgi:RNA recognition motif-containing protein